MARITAHTILRYRERVEPVDEEKALAIMLGSAAAIDTAAAFGCSLVVLGNGARLRLDGNKVVTVLEKRRGRAPRRG